jgi:hypothetical protein
MRPAVKPLVIFVVAVGCLATAVQANAASVFGAKVDTLTVSPTSCNTCTIVSFKHYDGTTDNGSPAAGILTKVRLRYTGPAATGFLRVQHPTGVANEFRNDGETEIPVAASNVSGGTIQSFPTRMKIAPGDHLGVAVNANAFYLHSDSDALCGSRANSDLQPVGGNLTFSTANCGPYDLLAEGTVEADVDGDGFGDESQDLCPTNASTHATCPVPAPTRKKCKKKSKRHSADAAKKKKCKKRKK